MFLVSVSILPFVPNRFCTSIATVSMLNVAPTVLTVNASASLPDMNTLRMDSVCRLILSRSRAFVNKSALSSLPCTSWYCLSRVPSDPQPTRVQVSHLSHMSLTTTIAALGLPSHFRACFHPRPSTTRPSRELLDLPPLLHPVPPQLSSEPLRPVFCSGT